MKTIVTQNKHSQDKTNVETKKKSIKSQPIQDKLKVEDKRNNLKKAEKNAKESKKAPKENKKDNSKAKKLDKNKTVNICDRQFDMTKYGRLLSRYFAHRGVHTAFPENSIPAFQTAIDMRLGIELDVHLTKDGQLVVFHDDNLYRMTGEKDYVRFKTVEELKKLRLNNTDYTIPTLQEVLKLVAGKTPILLEIKTEANLKKICKKTIEELKNYLGDVFIQAFNPFVLRYFYKHAPNYLRGQLSSFFVGQNLSFLKRTVIKKLRLNKFAHIDFISYNIEDLPNKYVNKTDVPILTYTISTKEQFVKAKIASNNLIIDNPDVTTTK